MRIHHPAAAALAAGLVLAAAACAPAPDGGSAASADGVTVFAAASLSDAAEEMGQAWTRAPLRLNVGSSSQLAAQILAGARADVVVAADQQSLAPLREAGLIAEETAIASNRLVLALAPGNPGAVDGLPDLAVGGVRAAACAESVPCGRAAERVLAASGVELDGESREDDVRSVLTKVTTGQADAGLVYLTDALAAADQGVTYLDLDDPEPNRYPAALTVDGAGNPAAVTFYDWLAAGGAEPILRDAGFGPAEPAG